jgi:hypothetical protein
VKLRANFGQLRVRLIATFATKPARFHPIIPLVWIPCNRLKTKETQ